jgi:ADP-ribose pyrophosphatase YjhB (NUDIX family)
MIEAYGITLYKKEKNCVKLLLCKSVKSNYNYGFLKGVKINKETNQQTAIREFYEESGIKVDDKYLDKFFAQFNETKNIGIYLINYDYIKNTNGYFYQNDTLKEKYLCKENSLVRFFDIDNLPPIKKKQTKIAQDITNYIKKNL